MIDVLGAEADPLEDERNDRFVFVTAVALPWDPAMSAAHLPTAWTGGDERLACLEVAITVLVADEPVALGRALEHRRA